VLATMQKTGLHVSPIIFFVMLWATVFFVIVQSVYFIFSRLFSTVPLASVCIPAELPHPDPAGESPPFQIPLLEATQEQLEKYISFRGLKVQVTDFKAIAADATVYKAILFDAKTNNWEYDHFYLKKKGLSFPAPAPHWAGWTGWWAENGPYKQAQMPGSLAFAFEHFVCGFLFPMNYLYGKELGLPLGGDELNFAFALYGDIGANIVTTTLCVASYVTNTNLTLEKYSRAIWPLIILHHVAATGMSCIALTVGPACPKDLACLLIISLLGTTGMGHLLIVPFDMTPWNDNKVIKLFFQGILTSSMIWFRVLYWTVLVYRILIQTYVTNQGVLVWVFITVSLLLFTVFNLEFVGYHYKAVKHAHRHFVNSRKLKSK